MTTTFLPEMDAIYRSLCTSMVALRVRAHNSLPTTFLGPCEGTPEGVMPDPPTSLRFQFDGPALWFKTTPQGIKTGWINISSGGGGGAQTWAQVLATGASSGANSPIVEAGQTLSFGDVSIGQTIPGSINIDGDVIPTVAANLGSDADRWDIAYINHLVGLYVDNLPTGTTLGNEYVVDITNGDDYDLPTAAENGSMYIIRNRDGALTSTLTPQPGQTIEGAASLNLSPGNAFLLVADGTTTWRAIGLATGGGVVTLQAAITNQGAVPTTQITNTNIELGDGTGWILADASGTPVVGIFGDDNASAFTVQGGTTVADAGQGISLVTGAAAAAAQAGGALLLSAGIGNTSGTGGQITMTSGAGGATGTGGEVALTTGAGGATSGGSGALVLATGATTDGPTGSISMSTANALGTNAAAGDISILGGSSTGTAEGADVSIVAGIAGATGTGGDLVFAGGLGGATSGAGGDVSIAGGAGVDGDGGDLGLTGGTAVGTNRTGGQLTLVAGASTGNAISAPITLQAGTSSGTGIGGRISLIAGAGATGGSAGGSVILSGGAATGAANDGGSISVFPGAATGAGINGRLVVAPVWTGDGVMVDLVGNGANSGTISLHSGSRAGGPDGVVSSEPGSYYGYNGSGSAIAGAGYINVGTTSPSTAWAPVVTGGSPLVSALYAMPGIVVVADAVLQTFVSYTIPAGLLTADGDMVIMEFGGDLVQANVAAQNVGVGIRLGGVTLWFDSTGNYTQSGNRRAWNLKATLKRASATTCTLVGVWVGSTSGNGTTTGVGDITTAPQGGAFTSDTVDPAANWSIAQLVELRVQQSAAGGSDITARVAWAKFIPAP